jgi:hypothetical protein
MNPCLILSDGKCVFANHNMDLWEKFDVEVDDQGHLFFISCHTGNVMQCNSNGLVTCANTNRLRDEQWTIAYPPNTNIPTSSVGITGAVVAGGAGAGVGAAVAGPIAVAGVQAVGFTAGGITAGMYGQIWVSIMSCSSLNQ